MRQTFIFLLVALPICLRVEAQVTLPPQAGNNLSVSVSVSTSQDPSSGLYTYSYTVTNAANSKQELWIFALELTGVSAQTTINPGSPNGWLFAKHHREPTVS